VPQILDYKLHADPGAFSVNEMPYRSYFIPLPNLSQAALPREETDFFTLLNGEWKFRYVSSLYEMDDFYKNDYDDSAFGTVQVPENWQTHGVDYAQYQSSPYPFHFNPPFVPEKNPAAAYVREFDYAPKASKRYELHFEGKDSCIYVWLNGRFIGYGESPHNDSAFDVTDALQPGRNRLCVMVLKWCSGTYLDDQDKIRLSGLFRDVYLLERREGGLEDFRLHADMQGHVQLNIKSTTPAKVEIFDQDQCLLAWEHVTDFAEGQVEAPRLWSAEKPYLYRLVISCAGEVICHRFGFRDVCVKDGVFMVNEKPVKLYGVNRHDSDPDTGYVVNRAHMRRDLVMMKQHNVNAVRTSHYPNSPLFYEMCDELGLYVLSEADMECHGCTYVEGWERIVGNPAYGPAIHDRMVRMGETLKNFTSIVIWSLGNESGWGINLHNEAAYMKHWDSSRPLHYESVLWNYAQYSDEEKSFVRAHFDFYSRMYPSFEQAKTYNGEADWQGTCYMMCEYSHSTGNSCGVLRHYDELIQKDPHFVGGFIWEWCEHAMRLTDENGVRFLGYGGDMGEKHHMGTICLDGMVSPDRVPHSALREFKAVYAPIRFGKAPDGRYSIWNRHDFCDFSAYDLRWRKMEDGKVRAEGILSVNAAPGETVYIDSPVEESCQGRDGVLLIEAVLKEDCRWAKAGHAVAAASYALKGREEEIPVSAAAPQVNETAIAYEIAAGDCVYTFRKDSGELISIKVGGKEILASPFTWNCYRAPTDNDRDCGIGTGVTKVGVLWSRSFAGNAEYSELQLHQLSLEKGSDYVELKAQFFFGAQGRMLVSRGQVSYRIDGSGRLTLSQQGAFSENLPFWLPRYGYILELKGADQKLCYFGYGPYECYEDKSLHALLGRYDYLPDDPMDQYEYPQECGSRMGVRWVEVKKEGYRIRVSGAPFAMSASHYDVHQVAKARHQKELIHTGNTFLFVDWRMSGVGCNSLRGEMPPEDCRINPGETFDFTVSFDFAKQ